MWILSAVTPPLVCLPDVRKACTAEQVLHNGYFMIAINNQSYPVAIVLSEMMLVRICCFPTAMLSPMPEAKQNFRTLVCPFVFPAAASSIFADNAKFLTVFVAVRSG